MIKIYSVSVRISTVYSIRFLELVSVVDELKPVNGPNALHKPGLETWTCAWSKDNRYFAWSCGDKFVRLVPWEKDQGRL